MIRRIRYSSESEVFIGSEVISCLFLLNFTHKGSDWNNFCVLSDFVLQPYLYTVG